MACSASPRTCTGVSAWRLAFQVRTSLTRPPARLGNARPSATAPRATPRSARRTARIAAPTNAASPGACSALRRTRIGACAGRSAPPAQTSSRAPPDSGLASPSAPARRVPRLGSHRSARSRGRIAGRPAAVLRQARSATSKRTFGLSVCPIASLARRRTSGTRSGAAMPSAPARRAAPTPRHPPPGRWVLGSRTPALTRVRTAGRRSAVGKLAHSATRRTSSGRLAGSAATPPPTSTTGTSHGAATPWARRAGAWPSRIGPRSSASRSSCRAATRWASCRCSWGRTLASSAATATRCSLRRMPRLAPPRTARSSRSC
mmetsp:Transcript_52026/g.149211  ORF Transcript_52026/g.149211 Transcript_52026/m.149211 type:complete len:318 (-) Transcript_52026:760-1713(-)